MNHDWFACSDLLQVHLRRHENRSFEKSEENREITPPHTGHRNTLLRRTNLLWNDDVPTLVTGERSILTLSGDFESLRHVNTNFIPLIGAHSLEPQSERYISVTTPSSCDTELHCARHMSNQDYNSLIFEFPVSLYKPLCSIYWCQKVDARLSGHQRQSAWQDSPPRMFWIWDWLFRYTLTILPFSDI